jgi:hypothetical protein
MHRVHYAAWQQMVHTVFGTCTLTQCREHFASIARSIVLVVCLGSRQSSLWVHVEAALHGVTTHSRFATVFSTFEAAVKHFKQPSYRWTKEQFLQAFSVHGHYQCQTLNTELKKAEPRFVKWEETIVTAKLWYLKVTSNVRPCTGTFARMVHTRLFVVNNLLSLHSMEMFGAAGFFQQGTSPVPYAKCKGSYEFFQFFCTRGSRKDFGTWVQQLSTQLGNREEDVEHMLCKCKTQLLGQKERQTQTYNSDRVGALERALVHLQHQVP